MSSSPIESPGERNIHTGDVSNYGDESYASTVEQQHLCQGPAADVFLALRQQTQIVKKVMKISPAYFTGEKAPSGQKALDKIRENFGGAFKRWCFLNHELRKHNCVQVFFVDTKALSLYEEYCINGDLRNYSRRITSDAECLKLFQGLAWGLLFLHQQDPPIVHGCVNPGCVYITGDLEVKLGEPSFSQLAVEFSHLTPSISVDWLVRWMSPEFFAESQSEALTTQSDIWSLGCTFLEIVTGRLPYHRYKSNTEILEQIITGVPPDLDKSFQTAREIFSESYIAFISELAKVCWLSTSERPDSLNVYTWLVTTDTYNTTVDTAEFESTSFFSTGSILIPALEPTITVQSFDPQGHYYYLAQPAQSEDSLMSVPPGLDTRGAINTFVHNYVSSLPKSVRRVRCSLCQGREYKLWEAKASNLARHIMAHNGVKQFGCPYSDCPRGAPLFTTRDQGEKHLDKHHSTGAMALIELDEDRVF